MCSSDLLDKPRRDSRLAQHGLQSGCLPRGLLRGPLLSLSSQSSLFAIRTPSPDFATAKVAHPCRRVRPVFWALRLPLSQVIANTAAIEGSANVFGARIIHFVFLFQVQKIQCPRAKRRDAMRSGDEGIQPLLVVDAQQPVVRDYEIGRASCRERV